MKTIITILILILSVSILSTYSNPWTSELTAEEIIDENINNDIFMLNSRVYINVENFQGVKEMNLTPTRVIGIISNQYDYGSFSNKIRLCIKQVNFRQEMATRLPRGAKIYSTMESFDSIVLVLVNGKYLKYKAIMEG